VIGATRNTSGAMVMRSERVGSQTVSCFQALPPGALAEKWSRNTLHSLRPASDSPAHWPVRRDYHGEAPAGFLLIETSATSASTRIAVKNPTAVACRPTWPTARPAAIAGRLKAR
jgi:hypothetical protein